MGNSDLILAGVNGSGDGGSSLAYFAPADAALPTNATADPAAAYLDAGWITTDGLTVATAEDSTDINAFGTFAPVRTITTSSTQTFEIAFLESNPVSLAVYHRKALDAITVDPTGAMAFTTGPASAPSYRAVFDLVDGDNLMRAVCPKVQVTDRGDMTVQAGEAVTYPVTLTAYPDTDGNSIYWYYVLGALAA